MNRMKDRRDSVMTAKQTSKNQLAVKKFFSREPPAEYLEEWRQSLEKVPEESNPDEMSVLIFKLANEWFSLAAESLTEVTPLRRIHTIPHRSNTIFIGMVNVRGQLLLCCSLHGLLGLKQIDLQPLIAHKHGGKQSTQIPDDAAILTPERLLVTSLTIGRVTRRWTFPVNKVAGVHRIGREELREVPSTVGKPGQRLSNALFNWDSNTVSLLDTSRLFEDLQNQIPS